MISQIHIQNFKALIDHTVDFKQLTVLAGANSVGKSSVIQCLLLAEISQGKPHDAQIALNGEYLLSLGSAEKILSDEADNQEIRINITDIAVNTYSFTYNLPPENERFLILKQPPEPTDGIIWEVDNFMQGLPLRYLNAERMGPRVRYEMKNYDFNVGFQGEYTIDVLAKHGQILRLAENKCFPNDSDNKTLRYQVQKWMNFVLPGVEIDASVHDSIDVAQMSVNDRTPPNVGFGISYVLPIIVAGLIAAPDSLLIIENPEAHLHPYGQSKMGQFLAKMAGAGVQIVVETHSEHVINGMCLGSLKKYILHEEIMVNFFDDKPNKRLKITPISISEEGDLSDWPIGFFDQQEKDLIEINRLKRQTRT